MLIPVTAKGRDSGFFTWEAKHEKDIHILLRGLDEVRIIFQGHDLGPKKINRKTRRIHLGATKEIDSNALNYKLTRQKDSLIIDLK